MDDDSSDEHSETSSDLPGSEYCTPLMMAAALGDAELIQTLLNAGADPNERNQNGTTALMMAAEHNHISVVRVLLHNPKTQVNVKDSVGRDALSYSAARGNLEMFALLLTFGGAHLEKNPAAATKQHPLFVAAALWYAAANNQIECCSRLLDKGADLRITTNTFFLVISGVDPFFIRQSKQVVWHCSTYF
nr:ankyrin repeat domain-containing protein [Oxalobacteraceae bacterium]